MSLNHKFVCLALALSLAGCASMGFTTDTQKVEAACVSISTANKIVAPAIRLHKLDSKTQAEVISVLDETDPICKNKPYPTVSSLKGAALQRAADKLTQIAAKL